MLNPDGVNVPYTIDNIQGTMIDGKDLGIDGYLDIGLIDTMKDMFVNFIGAVVFSCFGFLYVKKPGEKQNCRGADSQCQDKRCGFPYTGRSGERNCRIKI